MNLRRVFTLSLTMLVAAGAGYGLLGLKAPKQASPPAAQASGGVQTIVAVGPDGNLYAVRVPAAGGAGRSYRQDGYRPYAREEEERY